MSVRMGVRVGNNAALLVGPVGALVLIGLCALVLGGLVGWVLPAVVLLWKLAILAFVVGTVWVLWWTLRYAKQEQRTQERWEALSPEEQQQERERLYREGLHATTAQLEARRLARRPSGFR